MPPKRRKTAAAGRLIGYARVSTEEQGTDPQLDELRAAGCDAILEEHASGADRSRPVLARLLRDIRPDETPVLIRAIPRIRRAWSRSRCWRLSPSSNGRGSPNAPKPVCAPPAAAVASAA